MALIASHRRSSSLAAAVAGLGLLAAACGDSPTGASAIPGDFVCSPEDLSGAYFMQIAGEVTVQNLADLADDAPARRAGLQAAGLQVGRFNYWKQAVGHPPFDPPLEAVCQAMEFATGSDATRFVNGLRADPAEIATTAITWFPESGRTASEAALPPDVQLPAGARAFRLQATSPEATVTMYAVVAAHGRYVQAVYLGNGNGGGLLTDATAVLERLTARTGGSIAP